jgi:alkanesulfonate monooxygenase SsuD/methylene tetrahydromethanopterin reductase-like flavin-dependent oxidoreductase (luciferase family)
VLIGFKCSPQDVDWPTLDATWAAAGELGVFDSGWMNDHLSHPAQERYGPSYEAMIALTALVHHVPGMWVGHLVLSNTFRHPAVLAKQATALDHATNGRFILGLGAGWHEWEHEAFGVDLPPIKERIDRLESAVRIIRALGSDEARQAPGVELDSEPWPLKGATNEPPPLTRGGPPLWLGGQKPRGIGLAARYADGWNYSNDVPGQFELRRDTLYRACERVGRDPGEITVSVQLRVGLDRASQRAAVDETLAFARGGCSHIVLWVPAQGGPNGLREIAREVVPRIRDATG